MGFNMMLQAASDSCIINKNQQSDHLQAMISAVQHCMDRYQGGVSNQRLFQHFQLYVAAVAIDETSDLSGAHIKCGITRKVFK